MERLFESITMGGNKLNLNLVARAFDSKLSQEALAVLILLAITAVFFNVVKAKQLKRSLLVDSSDSVSRDAHMNTQVGSLPSRISYPEEVFKKILRVGFGILWVLDGLLQMQSAMPIELPNSVILPSTTGSPAWVREMVKYILGAWQRHPITYATGVAWIQLGIGLLLLIAPKGLMLRIAGITSSVWAICVWIFGESFGGIFAPEPSWLFGTPGAALIYFFAGLLLFLPDGYLTDSLRRQRIAKSAGVYFLIMFIIQIWPNNNYWVSTSGSHSPNPLANDVLQMSQMSQPTWLKEALVAFASFVTREPVLVNLVVSLVLGLSALSFFLPYKHLRHHVLVVQSVMAIFAWVFFQDLGFIGGVGTDPNSMIPTLIIIYSIYVLDRDNLINFHKSEFFAKLSHAYFVGKRRDKLSLPATASTYGVTPVLLSGTSNTKANDIAPMGSVNKHFIQDDVDDLQSVRQPRNMQNFWRRMTLQPLGSLLRIFMSLEAIGVIGMGALPVAIDMDNQSVSPLVAEAYVGVPYSTDSRAQNFTLLNQNDHQTSLYQYKHKKLIFLVFLDPVCTSDCPLIAQEVKKADMLLGNERRFVEFIAVDANPLYLSTSYLNAFDAVEQMNVLPNWQYLTGSKKALTNVWNSYGISVAYAPAGAMVVHSELAYVISPDDKVKEILDDSPVYDNSIAKASFISMFYDAISKYLPKKTN